MADPVVAECDRHLLDDRVLVGTHAATAQPQQRDGSRTRNRRCAHDERVPTALRVNRTGIDFEVGVPARSATLPSGTSGFVSGK